MFDLVNINNKSEEMNMKWKLYKESEEDNTLENFIGLVEEAQKLYSEIREKVNSLNKKLQSINVIGHSKEIETAFNNCPNEQLKNDALYQNRWVQRTFPFGEMNLPQDN